MSPEVRNKMRFGWYSLCGSIVIAAVTFLCLRLSIAQSDNALKFCGLVLILCAGVAVLSLLANGIIALDAYLKPFEERLKARQDSRR